MHQSQSCMINVKWNPTPLLFILPEVVESKRSMSSVSGNIHCVVRAGCVGPHLRSFTTSDTTASASSPFHFPDRARLSHCLPWPKSYDAVALNMSNIHSVSGWWKSKVIIWSEFKRVKPPVSSHICQQFVSNLFFSQDLNLLCHSVSVQSTNKDILFLWTPTECAISCKFVIFCYSRSFYLTKLHMLKRNILDNVTVNVYMFLNRAS